MNLVLPPQTESFQTESFNTRFIHVVNEAEIMPISKMLEVLSLLLIQLEDAYEISIIGELEQS